MPESDSQPELKNTKEGLTRERLLDNAQEVIARRVEDGMPTLSDLSMRKLAEGAVATSTATKYFKDQYDVCAALDARNRLAGTGLPQVVQDVIKDGANFHYNRLSKEPEHVLAAKLRKQHVTVEQAEQVLADAKMVGETLQQIQALGSLAAAYVQRAGQQLKAAADQLDRDKDKSQALREDAFEQFGNARRHADEGLTLVVERDLQHIEAGIECVALAAHAARALSRQSDQAARFLSFVQEYKGKEASWARRLHLSSRAAVAQFHASRADALIKEDPERSLRAFVVVASELYEAHQSGERIDPDYLVMLISRLCAEQLAYPHLFGAEHRAARDRLMSLYPRDRAAPAATDADVSPPPRETLKAARAFVGVVDSAPDYMVDIPGIDMIRVEKFGAVGLLCLARVLREKYKRYEAARGIPNSHSGSEPALLPEEIAPTAESYLVASLAYYRRAAGVMRRSGSAGVLRKQAVAESEALKNDARASKVEQNLPLLEDRVVEIITSAMDQLILVGFLAERANPRQILRLLNYITPVYHFIADRDSNEPTIFDEPGV